MFRHILSALVLSIIALMSSCSATKATQTDAGHENLIIYYDPSTGKDELLKAVKKYGSDIIYIYQNINGIAITVPKDKTDTEAIKYYEKIKGVLSVTKDTKLQLD